MIANLTLLNSNINARERDLDGQISNGSYEYELVFKIKTDKMDIEILKIDCYINDNKIYFNTEYGFHGSIEQFCKKIKMLIDGLMNGKKSELNFLEDGNYFHGLNYNGYMLTIINENHDYCNKVKQLGINYILDLNIDHNFINSLNEIIGQLNNI
jgi:hypothetical protein